MSLRLANITVQGVHRQVASFNVVDVFADLPIKDGLVGAYFLSNQVPNPRVNYANLNKPLTVVGTPVVGKGYTQFNSHKDGFDTGLHSTQTNTYISAGYLWNDGIMVSNYRKYTAANVIGDTLRIRDNDTTNFHVPYTPTGVGLRALNIADWNIPVSAPRILVGIVRPDWSGVGSYNPALNENVSKGGVGPTGRPIDGNLTLRLGNTHEEEFVRGSRSVAHLIYNRNLGGSEVEVVERWLHSVFIPRWNLSQ